MIITSDNIAPILTVVSGVIALFINQRREMKSLKKNMDDNQNKKISSIENEISTIKNEIKSISPYIKETIFSRKITISIKKISNDIIKLNPDVQENSNMVTLLFTGRDIAINFAISIFTNEIEKTEISLLNEVSTVFDKLKMTGEMYFKDKKRVYGEDIFFNKYLKKYTQIDLKSKVLIKRIIENHKTEDEYIELICGFVADMYAEAIKAYRDFNKFQTVKNELEIVA